MNGAPNVGSTRHNLRMGLCKLPLVCASILVALLGIQNAAPRAVRPFCRSKRIVPWRPTSLTIEICHGSRNVMRRLRVACS